MSREAFDSLHSLTSLQPGVITNDRLGEDYPGDYKTFERTIPRQAPTARDWEVCMPISGSWGFKRSDRDFKSAATLIRNLVDIASKGGNYLLNVSPTGEGTLLPESVERLRAIGQWMRVNGNSIYGTSASPFPRLPWGRCTMRESANGATLYLHVFEWPENGELLVPGLKAQPEKVYLMASGASLKASNDETGVILAVPREAPDAVDSVIVVNVRGALEIDSASPPPSKDGSLVLLAESAYLHNNEAGRAIRLQEHAGVKSLGYWTDAEAWAEWSLEVDRPGRYVVWAELAVAKEASRFGIGLDGELLSVEVTSTGSYHDYAVRRLGTIAVDKAGRHTLRLKPDPDDWRPVNIRMLELRLSRDNER